MSHPDSHYAQLQSEIDADAQNLEAEYWSLAVDQNYVKALNREAAKRQDVIYGRLNHTSQKSVCLKPKYDRPKSKNCAFSSHIIFCSVFQFK